MKILEEIDLSENEIEIYKGFLENPHKTAASIARLLSMDKSSAYRACDNLEEKGLLISSPKKKGTTYMAADPEMLSTLFQERIGELTTQKTAVDKLVANLKQKKTGRAIETRVEYGIPAVQKAMIESLECKEKLIRERFRKHSFFEDKEHINFVKNNAEQRVRNNIKIKQLEYGLWFMKSFSKVMTKEKKYLKEVKILPKQLDDKNSLRIWDDHVNIFSEDDRGEVIVMTIRDTLISEMMKNIYDFIWDMSEYMNEAKLKSNN